MLYDCFTLCTDYDVLVDKYFGNVIPLVLRGWLNLILSMPLLRSSVASSNSMRSGKRLSAGLLEPSGQLSMPEGPLKRWRTTTRVPRKLSRKRGAKNKVPDEPSMWRSEPSEMPLANCSDWRPY